MTGFQAPNYTQVPNDFFEMAADMGEAELKVVLCLIRETFGYHRESVELSVRALARKAGLTPRNAFAGAERAIARGLVAKTITPDKVTKWSAVVGEDTPLYPLRQRPVSPGKGKVTVKESKEIQIKKNDDVLATISRAYQSEIGMITPMIAESIKDYVFDGFPVKWMLDAIHEAAIQNKRSWKYCEAIIKRWDSQGNQDDKKDGPKFTRPIVKSTNEDAIRSVLNAK